MGPPPVDVPFAAAFAAFDALSIFPVAFPAMSFRRGGGASAAISVLATIAIFGSQQAPAAAAVRASAVVSPTTSPSAASNYTPITPSFRILDTRSGLCGGSVCHAIGGGATQQLQITGYVDPGTGNSVPAGASAVVINLTEVDGTSSSFLTAYPAGLGLPNASNLNFPAHTLLTNLVTSQLSSGGAIDIFNDLGTVNVLGDVEGYFMPRAATVTAGEYHPIPPIRVCDTRAGEPINACNGLNDGKSHAIGPNTAVKVTIAGQPAWCAPSCTPTIPTDGTEEFAIINLTAIAGTVSTFLSVVPWSTNGCVYGGNKGQPPFSDVWVGAGKAQANRVFVDLAINQNPINICVYNAVGKANFIIDDDGWFGGPTAAQGEQFYATTPTRICDTRPGHGTPCQGHELQPYGVLTVAAAGQDGIPSSAKAVIANLTGVIGTANTFISAYPSDATSRPNVSDLNLSAGQVLANLTAITLSGGGSPGDFDLFNSVGDINAIVDVEGWFQ
jgi:hypothetical protein